MKVRVSFYRKAEVVAGRAPRYTEDVEADTIPAAKQQFTEPGMVIRRAYKAPDTPISTKPSYIFETEHYRVSYYRTSEMVAGRAPRYMVDIEADDYDDAQAKLLKRYDNPSDVVIRSIYKAPDTLIPSKPSYVFENSKDRNEWYSSHKTTTTERKCLDCKTGEVERYKRFCKACALIRNPERRCKGCDAVMVKPKKTRSKTAKAPSRRRYCEACGTKRKETQEKSHREKRAKQNTVDRIKTQVAWAQEKILTTPLLSCKLASRFQGLRLPHLDQPVYNPSCPVCEGTGHDTERNDVCGCLVLQAPGNRCRMCLQKFIDVQTVYLNNLMAESVEDVDETFTPLFVPEPENALSHAATA